MSEIFLCSKCKGRKVVFDPISLFLTVGLPLALLLESDDGINDRSVTKKVCPTCDGDGFLKFD